MPSENNFSNVVDADHQLASRLRTLFHTHGIDGLSCDSKTVRIGDAFFAMRGKKYDGNDFITTVLDQRIKLVITDDQEKQEVDQSAVVHVPDVNLALKMAVDIIYPRKPDIMLAATGTNGKTSVVSYCGQLFALLDQNAATIGTFGVQYFTAPGVARVDTEQNLPSLTTMDFVNFRKILDNIARNNINYLAFEASSHGLNQERIYGIRAQAACFTSFSQDHLDYHYSMDAYLQAKLRLFTENLDPSGVAILNSEMGSLELVIDYLTQNNVKFLTVGLNGELKIQSGDQSIFGQKIYCTFQGQKYEFETKIIGSFQAGNLLIAAMLVHYAGFDIADIIQQLPKLQAVKGRLERVTGDDSRYHVFVDYAHTPDALEKALHELMLLKHRGKLRVIFGCGGERDSGKRSLMGEVAAKIADEIIITDDNPRNEEPKLIRQEIIHGITKWDANYIEIADRRLAILQTINNMRRGDVLLIAGKGHEEYQIIGGTRKAFSDVAVAREGLTN